MSLSGWARAGLVRALPGLVCGVAGLALWVGLVVGRIGRESVPVTFWVAAFVAVGVVGLLSDVSAAEVAGGIFAGPLIASWWTAPRGDNDGLWVLIVPTIVVAAGLGGLLLGLLRRVVPAERPRGKTRRFVHRRLVPLAVVLLAGAVGTAWLFAERRANPYPKLEQLAATFPAPISLEQHELRRGGDPLCEDTCRAFVDLTFSTGQGPAQACEAIDDAIDVWHGASSTESSRIFNPAAGYYEQCAWRVELAGTSGHVSVSDEPHGTTVAVQFLDPHGAQR